MNTIEILSRLEGVRFTTEQARVIGEIFEAHHTQMATRDDMKIIREELKNTATKDELKAMREELKNTATKDELKAMREDFKMMREDFKYMVTKEELNAGIAKAKYDLVRWIVGAVIVNGLIATLLKFFG
ncbi:MAG: hypothetical protein GDA51_05450 [Ekhidna sp.]|nr:hypothetical protein [Ekhidna sp.]